MYGRILLGSRTAAGREAASLKEVGFFWFKTVLFGQRSVPLKASPSSFFLHPRSHLSRERLTEGGWEVGSVSSSPLTLTGSLWRKVHLPWSTSISLHLAAPAAEVISAGRPQMLRPGSAMAPARLLILRTSATSSTQLSAYTGPLRSSAQCPTTPTQPQALTLTRFSATLPYIDS